MKIKSIKKIKNIGLLNEIGYTNSDLFLYHNKNDNQDKCYSKCLIKGNNGTGKTTFSNLLYSEIATVFGISLEEAKEYILANVQN